MSLAHENVFAVECIFGDGGCKRSGLQEEVQNVGQVEVKQYGSG